MNEHRTLIFSATRSDLYFSYADSFDEMFRFSWAASEQPSSQGGVRFQEALGFDFAQECSPYIEVIPASREAIDEVGIPAEKLEVIVTIEDIALGIRRVFRRELISDFVEPTKIPFKLLDFKGMSFYRGFEVRATICRTNTLQTDAEKIWHRSQTIFDRSFIAKASVEEALFEISWISFDDEQDKKNVLMYVDWKSTDVSGSPSHDCFHVVANSELKDQFKRLDNNRVFGPLTVKQIANQLLCEIILVCLRYSDLDSEPTAGSLHEKVDVLLKKAQFDFRDFAKRMQGDNRQEVLVVQAEVSKFLQRIHNVGSVLADLKFGGYS